MIALNNYVLLEIQTKGIPPICMILKESPQLSMSNEKTVFQDKQQSLFA